MDQEKKIHSLQELHSFVKEISELLPKQAILLLSGDLGAGKTEFVKTLGQIWGMNDVSSPTFAIHQQYKAGGRTLDHFDLYRIKTKEELEGTGFWDILHRAEGIVAIEWPEIVPLSELPSHLPILQFHLTRPKGTPYLFCKYKGI